MSGSAIDGDFGFLDAHNAALRRKLTEAAETAKRWPDSSVAAARTFSEILLDVVASLNGAAPRGETETAEMFINRVRDAHIIDVEAAGSLHWVRMQGNRAVHGEPRSRQQAQEAVQRIRLLAQLLRPAKKSKPPVQPARDPGLPAGVVPPVQMRRSSMAPSFGHRRNANIGSGRPARSNQAFIALALIALAVVIAMVLYQGAALWTP